MIARKKGASLNFNLLDLNTTLAEMKGISGGSGPVLMEIDAIRTGFRAPPLSNPIQGVPHPHLTQDEKE